MTQIPKGLYHIAGRDARQLWNAHLESEQRRIDAARDAEFAMRNLREECDE